MELHGAIAFAREFDGYSITNLESARLAEKAFELLVKHIEDKRAEQWWATYRAAVTGLHAYGAHTIFEVHTLAADFAEIAHGKLAP